MRKLENLINQLSDQDWMWWPLLSLRPDKDHDIDNSTLAKITAVCGTLAAAIALIFNIPIGLDLSIAVMAICWALCFLIYKFVIAAAWNARARRLRGGN